MTIDFNSIVMLVGGVALYLVATRRFGGRAGDPTYEHFMARFAKPMKIFSVIQIAFVVLKILLSAF